MAIPEIVSVQNGQVAYTIPGVLTLAPLRLSVAEFERRYPGLMTFSSLARAG